MSLWTNIQRHALSLVRNGQNSPDNRADLVEEREAIGQLERQPPAIIDGARAASELCPLLERWNGTVPAEGYLGQVKLDGFRAVAPPGRILTREAVPFDAALHCRPALDRLEAAYGEPMVFDAEYTEEGGFAATQRAFAAGYGCGVAWIFDAVPYSEWQRNEFTQPLEDRLARLIELADVLDSPFAGVLTPWRLDTPAAVEAKARELWTEGHEGLVLKPRRGLYHRGRASGWGKVKQRHTVDCTILDSIVKDGRLSALLVRHDGRVQKIGAGIPPAVRRSLASDHCLPGKVVEIGYERLSERGAFIGGYFVRMRGDKTTGAK